MHASGFELFVRRFSLWGSPGFARVEALDGAGQDELPGARGASAAVRKASAARQCCAVWRHRASSWLTVVIPSAVLCRGGHAIDLSQVGCVRTWVRLGGIGKSWKLDSVYQESLLKNEWYEWCSLSVFVRYSVTVCYSSEVVYRGIWYGYGMGWWFGAMPKARQKPFKSFKDLASPSAADATLQGS